MASGYQRQLSEHEADDVFAKARIDKTYWTVTYKQDNIRELQAAIDAKYNSIKGNNYIVDYVQSQSGTRLIINCEICSKPLGSFDPFYSHESGKSHKKIRQTILAPKEPDLLTDLRLKPLNSMRGIFKPDTLEYRIDNTPLSVLGIQFVYKEAVNGEMKFTCQLCLDRKATCLSTDRMFQHLTSKEHNKKYMEVKFNFEERTHNIYDQEVQRLEELEGKIHGEVIDFSQQIKKEIPEKTEVSIKTREPEIVELGKVCSKNESNYQRKRLKSHNQEDLTDDVQCLSMTENTAHKNKLSHENKHFGPYYLKDLTDDIKRLGENPTLPEEFFRDRSYIEMFTETFWFLNEKLDQYFNKKGPAGSEGSESTYKIKQYLEKIYMPSPDPGKIYHTEP